MGSSARVVKSTISLVKAAEVHLLKSYVPLLCEISLNPEIASGGDIGEPAVLKEDSSGVFHQLAKRIETDIAPPIGMQGCSARMLDALDRAVASES